MIWHILLGLSIGLAIGMGLLFLAMREIGKIGMGFLDAFWRNR